MVEFSTLDTIESYDKLFREFNKKSEEYELLGKEKRLIYLTAGLGLSNSIHERFIKSILEEYRKVYELSQNKRKEIVKKYKSPKSVKYFIGLLKLDLDEAFELKKRDVQAKFSIIESVESLLNIISDQREIRNDYLHGDFNFNEDILFETFKSNIIEFQEIHSFLLKIIRYSFMQNINKLPNI